MSMKPFNLNEFNKVVSMGDIYKLALSNKYVEQPEYYVYLEDYTPNLV